MSMKITILFTIYIYSFALVPCFHGSKNDADVNKAGYQAKAKSDQSPNSRLRPTTSGCKSGKCGARSPSGKKFRRNADAGKSNAQSLENATTNRQNPSKNSGLNDMAQNSGRRSPRNPPSTDLQRKFLTPTHKFPVYVHSSKRDSRNTYFRNPMSTGITCSRECVQKIGRPLFIRLWNNICFFENTRNRRFRAFKGYCETGNSISDFSRRCLSLMSKDNADRQWLMACLTPEWRGLPLPERAVDFEMVSADPKNIPKGQCLILISNHRQMLPCSLLPKEAMMKKDVAASTRKAFVKHHSLSVMIPETKKCKIRKPDGSTQLSSGSCPLFDKSTFVRRSNQCQLQFEKKFYDAFPGFCETDDGRAVYGTNCDILSFRGNDQELYDTCKLEWDRRIVSYSKSQAYVIRMKSGLQPAGECLQTILTSTDRIGRNIRHLVDCMAIGRSVNIASEGSDCLVVAGSSEIVPCDFDNGRIAKSMGKQSMAAVISAIRNYRRQKQRERTSEKVQPKNVTLLILPLCSTMGRFYAKIAPEACPTCLINGMTVSKYEAEKMIQKHKLTDERMDESIFMYKVSSNRHWTATTVCQLKDSCTYCPNRVVELLKNLPHYYNDIQRSEYQRRLVAQIQRS